MVKMAFPGAQASRAGPKFNRMSNKGARRTVVALMDGFTAPLGLAILAAYAWLKTLSSNATMAMSFGRDPIGGGAGL